MPSISAADMIIRYTDAKQQRIKHENDWRMCAAHCMPRHFSAWMTEGPPILSQSLAQTRRIVYDTSGARALPKFMAVLERIATPHNMKWHNIVASDTSLMAKRRVQLYFDSLNSLLFKHRYNPTAKFIQGAAEVYASVGTYGTGPIYLGQRSKSVTKNKPSLLYKSCFLRDTYILLNDECDVDTVFRRFFLNVRQFKAKWPGDALPRSLAAQDKPGVTPKENEFFEFIHAVCPRTDYDPGALDVRTHPFMGVYICVKDQEYVGKEQGFRSMPYLTPRDFTESGDPYGFSAAMRALPSMGSASAMKKTSLKQGQKAADPVLLAHDDGVLNGPVNLTPGATNYGAVTKDGKELIKTLPTGNFQVSEKMLENERSDIDDCFFAQIFKMLMETPEMTATQVMDRVARESALLSPMMGRIQSEFLGPMIGREIDLLQEMGFIQEGSNGPGLQMPPELIEAKGEYEVVYTSPMAKGMYMEEVSGFTHSVQNALQIVNATKDTSHLDHFNFNVAIPESSIYMGTPPRWLNDDNVKKALKSQRDASMQQQSLMQNAAPIASAMATASKMGQGGGAGMPPGAGQQPPGAGAPPMPQPPGVAQNG